MNRQHRHDCFVRLAASVFTLGVLSVVGGCKSEVPDRDAPGGVGIGSEYERLVARNAGRDAGALVEPAKPAVITPTTRATTTAPTAPAATPATPDAIPATPAAPAAPAAPDGGATPAPAPPPSTGQ